MVVGGLYEESAISARADKERKINTVFRIFGWVFFVIAGFGLMYSFIAVPGIIAAGKDNRGGIIVSLVIWFGGIATFAAMGALCWVFKRRYNVSFDYIFVEDELRVTKVFNERKRKHLVTLHGDHILKIGYCDADSFQDCLRGLSGGKPKIITPNSEAAEGKQFIYILYSDSLGKDLYVLECRQMLLEYVVRAAGITKFTKQ